MLAALTTRTALSVALLLLLILLVACGGAAPEEQAIPQAPQAQELTATTEPAADPTVASTPFATAMPTVPSQVQADTPRLMLKAPEDNPRRGGIMQWARV